MDIREYTSSVSGSASPSGIILFGVRIFDFALAYVSNTFYCFSFKGSTTSLCGNTLNIPYCNCKLLMPTWDTQLSWKSRINVLRMTCGCICVNFSIGDRKEDITLVKTSGLNLFKKAIEGAYQIYFWAFRWLFFFTEVGVNLECFSHI